MLYTKLTLLVTRGDQTLILKAEWICSTTRIRLLTHWIIYSFNYENGSESWVKWLCKNGSAGGGLLISSFEFSIVHDLLFPFHVSLYVHTGFSEARKLHTRCKVDSHACCWWILIVRTERSAKVLGEQGTRWCKTLCITSVRPWNLEM